SHEDTASNWPQETLCDFMSLWFNCFVHSAAGLRSRRTEARGRLQEHAGEFRSPIESQHAAGLDLRGGGGADPDGLRPPPLAAARGGAEGAQPPGQADPRASKRNAPEIRRGAAAQAPRRGSASREPADA